MKKILLATDLASKSDRAMGRSLRIAKEQGASLDILHVIPAYKSKAINGARKNAAKALVNKMLNPFDGYNHLKITIEVVESKDIHQSILEYAHNMNADLVVMGLHGKTKVKDLFAGTVVERVIRKGNKPVLMVKGIAADPYQKVVAGIDFAPASRNSLRLAYDLCPRASFEIVHTYYPPTPYTGVSMGAYVYIEGVNEEMKRNQEKVMKAFINTEENYYKKKYGQKQIKLKHGIVESSPHVEIIKSAKRRQADLITLGAHSKSIITPSKLGGSAQDILAKPPCDILILSE